MSSPMDFLSRSFDVDDDAFLRNEDSTNLWSAVFGRLLLQNMPLRQNVKILDLGSGTGFPSLELASMFDTTCAIFAADISKAAVNRSKEKTGFFGHSHVHHAVANAALLPYQSSSFDIVVSNLGLNNFSDPIAALTECYRVMVPYGELVLTTNPVGNMQEFYELFEDALFETELADQMEAVLNHIHRRFSLPDIDDLFAATGFKRKKTKTDKYKMRFCSAEAFFSSPLILAGFLPAWKALIPEASLEKFFTAVENAINKASRQKGEFRLSVPMLYIEAVRI